MRSRLLQILIVLSLWPGLVRVADADVDALMQSFDWERIDEDAVRLLRDYIRIDNTNPPGNEIDAALFLADLLEPEGIAAGIHCSEPGRASLLARLPGRGTRKPVLMMSHSDVVPADPGRWDHPPFSGAVADGYLWGRGTIDTKSLTIIQLLALREFKRAGVELDRDLLVLAQADEEMGGGKGVGWLVEELPELLDVEYVLDEGGTGITGLALPVRTVASIITAEKGVVWIRLEARGDAGHASVPWEVNAVHRLARAVARVSDWEQDIQLSATSRAYLETVIASTGTPPPADAGELLARTMTLASADPLSRRKLVGIASNTINPTRLEAGVKTNVVPAEAVATLDCRIVPGQSVEDFVKRFTERIDDPLVRVEVLIAAEATESPIDTPLFAATRRAVHRWVPDSISVPFMALGGSDSRFFRERGITAYGFHPAMLDEEDFLAHQPNERISLEKYKRAIRIYFEVLLRVGVQDPAVPATPDTQLPAALAPVQGWVDGCFATSPACALCHSASENSVAMKDVSGRDVAPYDLWQSAMMANSARDPLWRAMVSAEVARHPTAKAAIEAKCLRCHAPMATMEKQHAASTLALSELYDPEARFNQLALDGVSCTMCHQIEPDGLGTDKSFSGGFDIASAARIYGPHVNPMPGPMQRFSTFTPTHATHVTTSALCATCHTLTTHALDDDGAPTDHQYLEQSPYLEWRNSVYNDEIDAPGPDAASCQDCHVPREDVDGTRIVTRIARNPGGFDFGFTSPRRPFGRHVFVGGNTLTPAIMRDHAAELGTTAPAAAFDATIAAARRQLRRDTARLEITPLRPTATHRRFRVTVTNLSGHKFPTGHPTRRAWLRVEVRDGRGRSIFVSGAHDDAGRIVDGSGRLASDRVGGGHQPHHTVIDRSDQVQVYEVVMADADGEATFSLMQATGNLKDNRLLPRGWSAKHRHGAATAPVGVTDPDFLGGRDAVVYSVPTGDTAGPWTVEVTLLYQVLGARFAQELLLWDTPEMRAFRRYYEAADRTPEPVTRATATIGDPG